MMLRKILTIAAFLFAALPSSASDPDSVAFANGKWKLTRLEKGAIAIHGSISMFNSTQRVSIIRYPASKFRTEILSMTGKDAEKTSSIGRRFKASFALNGSYFNMETRKNTVYLRIGDRICGHTRRHEIYRANGVVALNNTSGTDILIAHSDTTQYESVAGDFNCVMAAGPILVYDGKIQVLRPEESAAACKKSGDYDLVFNQRHPRSVIGTDDKGFIYMVAIDGRFKQKAEGTTMWETAKICELIGMTVALNLDGGGSTTLWRKKSGVMNYPCRNKMFNHWGERRVPSIIVAQ